MPLDTTHWWLRWLPADSRAGVQRRALIVWGVAAVIALLQSFFSPEQHPLAASLVYSYGISTSIWFLCDPLRIVLRRWLRAEGPHYWAFNARSVLHLLLAIVLGYAAGTALGDAYTGRSTWQLFLLSPQRFWGFLLWSVGISAGFLFFFYHREKAHALERLATDTRLKLLESQLEPHMLFNTLANLRVLIGTDPARAQHMLDRMIAYLRATLSASRTTQHPLALEFERLRDYLELMAVRMGPRLAYTLDLPDALRDVPVPPLLLQPLVENAIRHGLEPQVEGGHITVRATTQESPHGPLLVIEVQDTGAGLPATLPAPCPGQSFGLVQVRERLATLHGAAGTLELIAVQPSGTSATVTFPLKSAVTP